jgi:hypothetical protein
MPPASALFVSVAGLAATVAAAGVTATAAPSSSPATAGFQHIVDDTGTIALEAPEGWAVDTAKANVGHDGVGFPSITVSPGRTPAMCDGCSEGWLLPMFSVYAEPYGDLPTESDCQDPESVPFDSGSFVGVRRNGVGCDMWADEVLASEASGALNIRVSMIYAGPIGSEEPVLPVEEAQPLFDTMLQTIAWTGSPYPNAPTGLPPARPSDSASPVWPFGPFWNAPQLGEEPVRGSGCGSQGQIGDVIPDGLWAGYVVNESTPTISIDLLCIFTGPAAGQVISEGTANVVNNEPDYVVVNNNTRLRAAPAAPGILLRDSVVVDGECVENPTAAHNPDPPRQAWVRIDGGQVTWILWGCGFPARSPAPAPANLPPAYPDYSDGVGSVWPYGSFRNVPQLGSEPVRGSGCGASGQLGPTIPDGLWAGFVTGYDATNNALGIDVLCIFEGDTAQTVLTEGTVIDIVNNEPDYLVINNSTQVRTMPSGLAAIIFGEVASDGQCVEGMHLSPEAVNEIAPRTAVQAWVRIDAGVVTWIFYGC